MVPGSVDIGSLPTGGAELLDVGAAQLRARQSARRERAVCRRPTESGAVSRERGFVVKDAPGGVIMERFSLTPFAVMQPLDDRHLAAMLRVSRK